MTGGRAPYGGVHGDHPSDNSTKAVALELDSLDAGWLLNALEPLFSHL